MDSIKIYAICQTWSHLGFSSFEIQKFLVKAKLAPNFSIHNCEELDRIITAMAFYAFSEGDINMRNNTIHLLNDSEFNIDTIKRIIKGSVDRCDLNDEAKELYKEGLECKEEQINFFNIR